MAVGAQGRNVAWGAVISQLWGRRLQLPLYRWWSGRMGGATLYRSRSFESSWLVVTGTEKTGRSSSYWDQFGVFLLVIMSFFFFLPVTIKAHVSMRRPAGRQVFRRTGLSLYFADRRSMTHHCKQPTAVVLLVSKVPSSVITVEREQTSLQLISKKSWMDR